MAKEIVRGGYVAIVKNRYTATETSQRLFDSASADDIGANNTFGMWFDAEQNNAVSSPVFGETELFEISDRVRRAVVQYSTNQEPVPTLGNDVYGDFLAAGINWNVSLEGFGDSDEHKDPVSIIVDDIVRARSATTAPERDNILGIIVARKRVFYPTQGGSAQGVKDGVPIIDFGAEGQRVWIGVATVQASPLVDLDWGRPRPFTLPILGRGPLMMVTPDDMKRGGTADGSNGGPVLRHAAADLSGAAVGIQQAEDYTHVSIGLTPGYQHVTLMTGEPS